MRRRSLNKTHLSLWVLCVAMALGGCQPATTESLSTETFVFEGTLLKLGPDPGFVSGRLAAYRLAKYRVEKVCSGKYQGKEIVVDHPIFTGKEFENIKIGDRVCLTIKVSDKVLVRKNAEEIRAEDEKINTFYVAEGIASVSADSRCCATSR